MSIAPIQPINPELLGLEGPTKTQQTGSASELFADAFDRAKKSEETATQSADKFAKDDPSIGIHEVMIASEKANIAIRYATTLKNKAVEAYKELMNTQV